MKKRFLALLFVFVLMMSACTRTVIIDKGASDKENQNNETQEREEAPQKSEETPLPVQSEEENLLPEMSSGEKREVNIFLSNFSEAGYDPTSGYFSQDEALINFAFTHVYINSSSKVVAEDGYMGISASDTDAVLKRFFGKTVPHKTPAGSKIWIFRNNSFVIPVATGDSYGSFSIATKIRLRQDGNYEVDFNVYNDPEIVGGDKITDKTIYSLSDSQAAAKYDLIGRGIAVLKPKKHNGEETYEIVSYLVEDY